MYLFNHFRVQIFIIIVSAVVLFCYYPNVISNLSTVFFSDSGDGLQNYYAMMYHIKYGDQLFFQNAMNYPYGENLLFTGGQPLLSNILRLFHNGDNHISLVLSSYNAIMLLSILLGPLFIYLVLTSQLKVSQLYAITFCIGIAFLSPQISRLSGHFGLTFIFAIPCFFYLIYLFDKKPTFIKTGLIALFVFFVASFHLYYLMFFGLISFSYLIVILFREKNKTLKFILFRSIHLGVVLIVPFLLLHLMSQSQINVTDRTSLPEGYFHYKSGWSGIFLESQTMPTFIKNNIHFKRVEWEGVAYIGWVGIIGLILGVYKCVALLLRKKLKLFFINNHWVAIILCSSLVGLMFSFAIPLKWSDWLFFNSGPLKQMRGIGRFAWLFYYGINLLSVFVIYNSLKNKPYYLRYTILIALTFVLYFEAHNRLKTSENKINNYFSRLTDVNNNLDENKWIEAVDFKTYQSILPLPFFHIGSENYLIIPNNPDIKKETYLLSLKSGLPTIAMSGSRTSLSQSYAISELFTEHYQTPNYINDLKLDKPILIVHKTDEVLTKNQALILTRAELVTSYNNFNLYSIFPNQLDFSEERYAYYESKVDSFITEKVIDSTMWQSKKGGFYNSLSFNDENNRLGLNNSPAFIAEPQQYSLFFKGSLPDTINEYNVSFWIKNYNKDIYPRTGVRIVVNSENKKEKFYYRINDYCKQYFNEWALIELNIKSKELKELKDISLYIYNFDLYDKKDMLIIDDLFIYPKGEYFFQFGGKFPRMNNRIILNS